MGLVKNIFGAIFGVIGGVFKAVLGIFGIGKQSEYYLEADEANTGNQSQEQPQAAAQEAKPAAKPAAQESAPAPAAKSEAPASTSQSTEAPAPKPVPVEPKPEPVGNFATDYLIAPSANMGRRRPGPSLSPFKDLAKEMKLPSGAR
jgi:hypothetical protein